MRLHGWSFSYVVPTTCITDALASLHWLRVPERIWFKIGVLASFSLYGLHRVAWVRSSVCPIYRIGVVSALPALITWPCHHSNCPLLAVEHSCLCSNMERSAGRCYYDSPSLPTFRKRLKTHLFRQSHPDIVPEFNFLHLPVQWLCGSSVTLSTLTHCDWLMEAQISMTFQAPD